MLRFNYSGKTDIGLQRAQNEDTYRIEPELGFCLVADGLGGAAAGELASRIFSETAWQVFQFATDRIENEVVERIRKAFLLAHENILDHARKEPAHKGMGCTAELMAISDEGFVLGHIGDSRTYRFRNGQLKQLTHDHSLIQAQIDEGTLSPEDAKRHPSRNIILRAVGIDEPLKLDLVRGRTYPDDQFLFCTDGLTNLVDDIHIQKALYSNMMLNHKVEHLIELALSGGGSDNITVILIEICSDESN